MKRIPFLFCSLTLIGSLFGGAAVMHQQSVQTFGAVSGLPDPALAPRPNALAVNIALEQYADPEPVLNALGAFHWLRQTFPWDEIEPARGQYTWEKWDALVTAAAVHQKEIIAVLNYSPAWARPGDHRAAPPAAPDDFAAFAATFAARYAGQIDVYQIWDEPNILIGWGNQPPAPAAYAALLQKAYAAIHTADPTATVVAAALAPTIETGPDNLSDLIYLQQLYDLGAGAYFDAAAGKPYGFYTGPDDRQVDPEILNFSRFTLLRQVMEKNGDGAKLLWGGNFGWNTLDSPWGKTAAALQTSYTLAAYQRALTEWPWAGPLALENYQPLAPADDPRWGFALADSSSQLSELGQALTARYRDLAYAVPGNYTARAPAAHYTGDWKFSELGADIPEQTYAAARLEIKFQGTDLALKVRRGDYRAYLYVEVDGQPANQLPRDERGAYLVLNSPDLTPQLNTIPVVSNLAPGQTHTAVIYPERGWQQWAVAGFSVGQSIPDPTYSFLLGLLAAVVLFSVFGLWHFGRQLNWGAFGAKARALWERLGATGQLILTALVGGLLYLSTWLSFSDDLVSVVRRSGDTWPLVVTAVTAGLFYFSPSAIVAVLALIALFILIYLRLDLALAFAAFFVPFYLQPRVLWQRGFALVEVVTLLALAAWLLQHLRPFLIKLKSRFSPSTPHISSFTLHLSSLDLALLALLLVATLSLFTAELKGVAAREYRLVIIDPLLFYFLLRKTPLDRKAWWRIVDFFLLGAVAVAGIGLYQYVTGTDLITAEEGVARIRSVYGSPNNLALYLGRAFPIAVAILVMGQNKIRRVLYGLAAGLLGITLILTFSKGALLFGVPAALAVILICWLGRWGWVLVGGGAAAGLGALPFISRLPRFAGLLNMESGTAFFRVKLWVSAWRMFLDQPLLGVGLDNFLYQYRGKYILPEAWEDPNLSHPHNIALDFLSRLGILGFACLVWLQIGFWRTAVSAYRRLLPSPAKHVAGEGPGVRANRHDLLALCVGLMAAMADMLAHGLVDHSFFLLDLAFAFCLILAAMQWLAQADHSKI